MNKFRCFFNVAEVNDDDQNVSKTHLFIHPLLASKHKSSAGKENTVV